MVTDDIPLFSSAFNVASLSHKSHNVSMETYPEESIINQQLVLKVNKS